MNIEQARRKGKRMTKESVVVRLTMDRASLNEYLGNTPNVSLESGVSEVLTGLFSILPSYCDRCGSGTSEVTGINGEFEFIEGSAK